MSDSAASMSDFAASMSDSAASMSDSEGMGRKLPKKAKNRQKPANLHLHHTARFVQYGKLRVE
jgi:hypothetical protein